jgi:UDP-N-acetylmuramate--alanine ligase
VYPAGEAPIVAADGRALARAVRVAGKVEPIFVEHVADVPAMVRDLVRADDVVLVMGAGSIGQIAPALAENGAPHSTAPNGSPPSRENSHAP